MIISATAGQIRPGDLLPVAAVLDLEAGIHQSATHGFVALEGALEVVSMTHGATDEDHSVIVLEDGRTLEVDPGLAVNFFRS